MCSLSLVRFLSKLSLFSICQSLLNLSKSVKVFLLLYHVRPHRTRYLSVAASLLSRSFLLRIQMSVGTFQSTSKGPRQSCSKSGGYPYDFNHILGVAPRVIKESICFHHSRGENPCEFSSYPVMIIFGIIEIGYSQIQEFHRTWCFSIVAAVMSFTYSHVVLGLDIAKIAGHPEVSTNRSHDDEKGRYVLSP